MKTHSVLYPDLHYGARHSDRLKNIFSESRTNTEFYSFVTVLRYTEFLGIKLQSNPWKILALFRNC